jgi:hypothetical protein
VYIASASVSYQQQVEAYYLCLKPFSQDIQVVSVTRAKVEFLPQPILKEQNFPPEKKREIFANNRSPQKTDQENANIE